MLLEVLDEKLIQLNIEAENFEDALSKSALPLLAEGKITKAYIEAILESNRENGPYFVLAKHVALPHASSKAGVLEKAIGITTLKTPVISGQGANDPVKYLFCLSATDQTSHLEALASLAGLLANPEFFDVLDQAATPKEIMDYLQKVV